jgi:hypothetical protein
MTRKSTWESATFWEKWTFSVANAMLKEGQLKALKFEDLLDIAEVDTSEPLVESLRGAYATSKKFWIFPRIFVALFKINVRYWLIIVFYTIVEALIRIALPLTLIFLLHALQSDSAKDGFIWAGVISTLSLLQVLSHHVLFFFSMRVGWNWKNATTALIYEGLFKLSSSALQATMTGRMVNLISNDVARLEEYPTVSASKWSYALFLQLTLLFFGLFRVVSTQCLLGVQFWRLQSFCWCWSIFWITHRHWLGWVPPFSSFR